MNGNQIVQSDGTTLAATPTRKRKSPTKKGKATNEEACEGGTSGSPTKKKKKKITEPAGGNVAVGAENEIKQEGESEDGV